MGGWRGLDSNTLNAVMGKPVNTFKTIWVVCLGVKGIGKGLYILGYNFKKQRPRIET